MSHRITITKAQWLAIDKVAEENIVRFASWFIEESTNEIKNEAWLASLKERYDLWKGIQQALINEEELTEAEMYALERDPAYSAE